MKLKFTVNRDICFRLLV